jgi:hypothetical protein
MTPWLSQPLLAAMLCGLAERVLNAVRVFRMLMSRLSGECHADLSRRSRRAKADVAPHRLPVGNRGIAKKEPQQQQHVDVDDGARAAVIAASVVAARATRTEGTGTNIPSAGPLIQNEKFPAAPAAAAVAAMSSILGAALALMVSRPRSGRPSNQEGELQGSGPRP